MAFAADEIWMVEANPTPRLCSTGTDNCLSFAWYLAGATAIFTLVR